MGKLSSMVEISWTYLLHDWNIQLLKLSKLTNYQKNTWQIAKHYFHNITQVQISNCKTTDPFYAKNTVVVLNVSCMHS